MSVTIQVSRGLCSPLRYDVENLLKKYGVVIFDIQARGYGHWHMPIPDGQIMPDDDIWVKKHVVDVTVSNDQAKWAERLLWQSNKMMLESPPLVPSLKWTAPPDCKAGQHGTIGRGTMFKAWSDNEQGKRSQPAAASGILGTLRGLFDDAPAPRRQRQAQQPRRARRQRRTR